MMRATGAVHGANVPIQQVGVSNFRLPLKFAVKGGEPVVLETSVTGNSFRATSWRTMGASLIISGLVPATSITPPTAAMRVVMYPWPEFLTPG